MSKSDTQLTIRTRIVCPHCWESFPTDEIHWVAEHPDLLGDSRLGAGEQQRFLPSRFDVHGNAIDAYDSVCEELACPRCHLEVPRSLLELPPYFVSIVGSPSCGKTYFLASMTWKLRETLPKFFSVSFTDADPKANRVLNEYEEQQFFTGSSESPVKLAKTEEFGHLYSTVTFGGRETIYPMPFLFSLRPTPLHPSRDLANQVARLVCMYDNAGESFMPGRDSSRNRVTRHLAKSNALLFLYDPTQEPKFRQACSPFSHDPQVIDAQVTSRQELILHELADRVRRLTNLSQSEKHRRPLFIIVTKYDVWQPLLGGDPLAFPVVSNRQKNWWALDMDLLNRVSAQVREMLWQYSPELVSAAESFATEVYYVPVSSLGTSPVHDSKSGQLAVRPKDIDPVWVEIPLLWTICRNCPGLVPFFEKQQTPSSPSTSPSAISDRNSYPPEKKLTHG